MTITQQGVRDLRPRVLLTGSIHRDAYSRLSAQAHLIERLRPSEEDLVRCVMNVDAIILRPPTRITRRVISAARQLRVIGVHGVGVDNVDMVAADEHNILVLTAVGANDEAVAEHTLACILALQKRLLRSDRAVREGDWDYRERILSADAGGTVLGVVGMGRIGSRVAYMCHRALGMRVIYSDPIDRSEALEIERAERVPLDRLMERADVVTVHAPLSGSTVGLIGRDQLARMKPAAYLVNVARGGIVDEDALVDAISSNHIAGAAIDVYTTEPPPPHYPLLRLDNVLLTPHSAALSQASFRKMSMIVDDVLQALQQPDRSGSLSQGGD